uniref:WW domain containing E3 ubiquitin protein ligase 2 n=2 Tax=Sus scrofa TaxID=9823 RepID=A0A8D0LLR7_PIG
MASASSSRAGVALPFEKSQLILKVVSAKPKVHSRQPRINSFVEVAVDGLPSETKKTGKRIGSSELLWNEIIILNVTAQSHLDLKVWSCHTLRNELLGTASVNLSNVLKNNGGKRPGVCSDSAPRACGPCSFRKAESCPLPCQGPEPLGPGPPVGGCSGVAPLFLPQGRTFPPPLPPSPRSGGV